jgi:hypothetical protein
MIQTSENGLILELLIQRTKDRVKELNEAIDSTLRLESTQAKLNNLKKTLDVNMQLLTWLRYEEKMQ